MRKSVIAIWVVLLLACAGAPPATEYCDVGSLRAALESAAPGDVVSIGACRIDGSVVVPAGVMLRGRGPMWSTIAADGIVVELAAGEGSSLRQLRVESSGRAAVVARDGVTASIDGVDIAIDRGVGIAIANSTVELHDVDIRGPITAETAANTETPADPAAAPAFGVLMVGGELTARDIRAGGVASAAVALVGVRGAIENVQIDRTVGVGLAIHGGDVVLDGINVDDTQRGRGALATAVLLEEDAQVDSFDLSIARSEGLGVFARGAGATTHHRLRATSNALAGVWAENSDRLELAEPGTALDDNGFGGVVTIDVPSVVRDAAVTRSRLVRIGDVEAGDGIQMVRPGAGSGVLDTYVVDNPRVGMIADGGGGDHSGFELERMIAVGMGSALGCVHQNGTFPASWDMGVERPAAIEDNDEAFEMAGIPLATAEVIGPGMLVDLAAISSGGINSVLE